MICPASAAQQSATESVACLQNIQNLRVTRPFLQQFSLGITQRTAQLNTLDRNFIGDPTGFGLGN